MYFNHAFRKTLLAAPTTSGGAALLTTTTTTTTGNLLAGQLGIYDKNYGYLAVSTAGTSIPFYIVQGSYYKNSGYSDKIGSHGGYQESVKSKMINPKYISRIFWIAAKAPQQQVVQIPVSAGLDADVTYRLRVDAKGSPALRFLSHNIYRVLDAYTGPLNATNPTFQKDPIATLINWKDNLNNSPYFNQLVQARVYSYATGVSLGSGLTYTVANNTDGTTTMELTAGYITSSAVAVGMRVTGTNIPANAFVTAFTSTSALTIKFPTVSSFTTSTVAVSTALKFWYDLYNNGGSGIVAPTVSSTKTYITGTTVETGATTATGTTASAQMYAPLADATGFSYSAGQEPFLELTSAYVETKFGNPTFTVTDNYDLEPLKIIASVMDDSGNPNPVIPIGYQATRSVQATIGEAGIATVLQTAIQTQGSGETVLRELILTGRYRQEAFGDGTNIDQFRMREIEANPGVLDMMSVTNRNKLYNKLCILHNVPRFNNPTAVFDNDQYLIEIAVPNTVPLSEFITGSVSNGIISSSSSMGTKYGDYIAESAYVAGGAQFVEII